MNHDDLNQQMSEQESSASADAPIGDANAAGDGEFDVVAEPGKQTVGNGTLIMGGVLLLGAVAIWFMYQRAGGPKSAAAALQETKQAQQTITNFLGNNGQTIRNMQAIQRDTEKVVATFTSYPSMTQIPLSDLRANPFRWKLPVASTQPTDEIMDRRRRDEERANMLKAVQGLQLQSIMCSETKRACMINNTLFKEGQQVETFTVEKITNTSVIVKSSAYRFELRMK